MRYLKYFIPVALFATFLLSCNKSTSNEKKEIIAEIGDMPIYAEELNTIIKQELFDELNRFYELKKKALEQLINVKLLQEEADKKNMPYLQYIDYYANTMIEKIGIDSLLKKYNLSSMTELHGTDMYQVSKESPMGESSLIYNLKGQIIDKLIDSLRNSKKIAQYIYPPKSPHINLEDLRTYYRGNLKSNVTMTVISDFSCESCINAHCLYDSIYKKYMHKVKFGYIHYSAMPSFVQIASDAASKQNKFWEFHDSVYAHKGYIDSVAVDRIAKGLSLDINRLHADMTSKEGKEGIEHTIKRLVLLGIYATPTIIINGRIIVNSGSQKEICHLIDEELSK